MAAAYNPLISIIIPVYNVAPYLREALDSAIHQTYEHLEILIIDDGSTDGSGAICDEYRSDPRVQVFHQINRGLSCARNVGLDRAQGDYFAFLDSDDAYHPEFIQRMLDAIDNADVVECMKANNRITLGAQTEKGITVKEGYYDRVQALRGLILENFTIGVMNKLYRRELWKGIRFPEGRLHEDYEAEYNIFYRMNRLRYLEQALYFRRHRPGSITHTFSRKSAEDKKLALDHVIDFVESHIPEVFDETHLNRARQLQMKAMIRFYTKGAVDVGVLREVCENVDPKQYGFKVRLACQMIRWCPWMLKIVYPRYEQFNRLAVKVFGR